MAGRYNNRGTQYNSNPFAGLAPSPYISQRVDEGFVDDKLAALQAVDQNRQMAVAQMDKIDILASQIDPMGSDNVLNNIMEELRGGLDEISKSKFGFADPNAQDLVRKYAKDFATNPDLMHMAEFAQMAKADIAKKADIALTHRVAEIGETTRTPFNKKGEQQEFERGWQVGLDDLGKQTQIWKDVLNSIHQKPNVAELNAQIAAGEGPLLMTKQEVLSSFRLDKEREYAKTMYKNTDEYRQRFKELQYLYGKNDTTSKSDQEINEEIMEGFEKTGAAIAKEDTKYGHVVNTMFGAGSPNDKPGGLKTLYESVAKVNSPFNSTGDLTETKVGEGTYKSDIKGIIQESFNTKQGITGAVNALSGLSEAIDNIPQEDFVSEELTLSGIANIIKGAVLGSTHVFTKNPLDFLEDENINIKEALKAIVESGDTESMDKILTATIGPELKAGYGGAKLNSDPSKEPFTKLNEALINYKAERDEYYENIQTSLGEDEADVPVRTFDDFGVDASSEAVIQDDFKDTPNAKFKFQNIDGETIEIDKVKNVGGFKRVGNRIMFDVTDEDDEALVATPTDKTSLRNFARTIDRKNYKLAAFYSDVRIGNGKNYYVGDRKMELPEGYEFSGKLVEDIFGNGKIEYQFLKNGTPQEVLMYDDNDVELGLADRLPGKDAFMFLQLLEQ